MPRTVLVDTAYLIAIIDPRDAHAEAAAELAAQVTRDGCRLVVTDTVLIEVLNFVCRTRHRSPAMELVLAIQRSPSWEVVSLQAPLLRAAQARYRRHVDKNWSMTDCISMEVMRARGIR